MPAKPREIGLLGFLGSVVVVLVTLGVVSVVMGYLDSKPTPARGPAPRAGAEAATPDSSPTPGRPAFTCKPVPPATTDAISSGLNTPGRGSILRAVAVRSEAYADRHFVAATMGGTGIEGDPGVWLTIGDLRNPTMILAVDSIARRFSVFPDANQTSPRATMSDPGAMEAKGCLR